MRYLGQPSSVLKLGDLMEWLDIGQRKWLLLSVVKIEGMSGLRRDLVQILVDVRIEWVRNCCLYFLLFLFAYWFEEEEEEELYNGWLNLLYYHISLSISLSLSLTLSLRPSNIGCRTLTLVTGATISLARTIVTRSRSSAVVYLLSSVLMEKI